MTTPELKPKSVLHSVDNLRLFTEFRTRSIEQFITLYNSSLFQDAACKLRKARGCSNPEDWAMDWSIRLRYGSEEDEELDRCLALCLQLLLTLVTCWQDPSNQAVTTTSILRYFKVHRLINILQLCIPMVRAKTLYRVGVWHGATNSYGAPWCSAYHAREAPVWKDVLEDYSIGPTIDDRLMKLMELDDLQQVAPLTRWFEPLLPPDKEHSPTLEINSS